METVNIAGVSCRKDKLDTFNYEKLMKLALGTGKKQNEIDKELREHGFKPTKGNTRKAKPDNTKQGRKSPKTGDNDKPKRDRKSRKGKVEKGS